MRLAGTAPTDQLAMDLHNICIVQAGKITSTTVNHSQQQRQRTVGAPTCVVALMTLLATLERAAGVVEEEFACQQVPPSGSPDIQVNLESNYILNYLSAVLFFSLGSIGTLCFQKLWRCCARILHRCEEEPCAEAADRGPQDQPDSGVADPTDPPVAAHQAVARHREPNRRAFATRITFGTPTPPVVSPTFVPIFPTEVYVTRTGDCYHAKSCSHTMHSVGIKALTLCSICKSNHDNQTSATTPVAAPQAGASSSSAQGLSVCPLQ